MLRGIITRIGKMLTVGLLFSLVTSCSSLFGERSTISSPSNQEKNDLSQHHPDKSDHGDAKGRDQEVPGQLDSSNQDGIGSSIKYSPNEIASLCQKELHRFPGVKDQGDINKVCSKVEVLDSCLSEEKRPIFHYERLSDFANGKRILTLALIHGDELPSGSVARAWMSRLEKVEPRNSWRVIPIMNPDGFKNGTRVNSRGVDLNRNFPTEGWNGEAVERWKKLTRSDPRRYPGPTPGSETETRCAMRHIETFKPDFIISVHTPLGVLDFDGPKMNYPRFEPLPWISLGNYPGSLGRYMWKDHKVPVLTIELKGAQGIKRLEQLDHLQDISGTVAIQSNKAKDEKN